MIQQLLRVALCLCVCLAFVAPARAADNDAVNASARKHFEEGTKAFNLGEFNRAVVEYKAAYNAKPDPVFLYNIAQAYRLANDLQNAVFFYRSYLRNEPNAPNRKEVDRRIHELEQQLSKQREVTQSPPNSPVPPGGAPPTASAEPPPRPAPTPAPEPAPPPPIATTTTTTAPEPTAVTPTAATPEATTSTENAGAQNLGVTRSADRGKPVYKKWWFWTAVVGGAAVVAVGVGLGVGLSGTSIPSSHLGNTKIF